VVEALKLLQGQGPEDLKELVLKMGMEIVRLAGVAGSTLSAKQTVEKHLSDGSALAKFKEMVAAQEATSLTSTTRQNSAGQIHSQAPAPKRGYVHTINAGMIARGVQVLAQTKKGKLDPAVGVSEVKKVGTQVKQGEPLMMIHYKTSPNSSLRSNTCARPTVLRQAPHPAVLVVERVA